MRDFKVASIRKKPLRVQTNAFFKKYTGSKFKDWISDKAFDRLRKWGYLKEYFEDVAIETFEYTEPKRKLLTDKIIAAIRSYGRDYDENITPENYVVIIGESTFFEAMAENRNESPFFGSTTTFMSNDIYYNDPYRGKRIMNFQVHVIPAMQGFALVPRVLIEKKV